jgi:hypothetical protein
MENVRSDLFGVRAISRQPGKHPDDTCVVLPKQEVHRHGSSNLAGRGYHLIECDFVGLHNP